MHTSSARSASSASRPGCSKHDVGELPQQVVEQHEVARAGGPRPLVGRRPTARGRRRSGRRAGPGAEPEAGERPRRPPGAARGHDRGSPAAPTASTTSPGRASSRTAPTRSGPSSVHGRERPLAHDDRVDELDRDVVAVRRASAGPRTTSWRPPRTGGPASAPPRPGRRRRPEPGRGHGLPPRPGRARRRRHRDLAEGEAAVVGRDEPVREHVEARARGAATRVRRSSRAFWNTPPLSATRSSAGPRRASRRRRRRPACATARWNAAATAAPAAGRAGRRPSPARTGPRRIVPLGGRSANR